jgi:hypothetical protein
MQPKILKKYMTCESTDWSKSFESLTENNNNNNSNNNNKQLVI